MHIITIYKIYKHLSLEATEGRRESEQKWHRLDEYYRIRHVSQNLGFQLLHNLDFICLESKIASLTRLTFARPEGETCSISVQSAADADKFNQIRLWMEN